jgi:hypothetical protein
MLATMSSKLLKQYEDANAHIMIVGLHGIFMNQARLRDEISKSQISCKLTKGSLVSPHVIKMIGYIKSLDMLGYARLDEIAMDMTP